MREAAQRQQAFRTTLLGLPGTMWLFAFFAVPLGAIVVISFFTSGNYGEVERPLTLESYKRFLGFGAFGWDPLYPMIILRSLWLAALTMLFCAGFGLPLAFWISSLPERWKTFALTLVVIPLWTNLLIRTYAWQMLLARDSLFSRAAAALGLVSPGEPLYPGAFAILVGMICDYLPFFVLPLYASVEKIDWTLSEAARDLGASGWSVFRHGIWPQIVPGLSAGIVLVFVPASGQFVIPDLLGGSKFMLLGNVIQQQFGPSRNWPFGSAVAAVAMIVVLLSLWLYARITSKRGGVL